MEMRNAGDCPINNSAVTVEKIEEDFVKDEPVIIEEEDFVKDDVVTPEEDKLDKLENENIESDDQASSNDVPASDPSSADPSPDSQVVVVEENIPAE